MQRLYSLNTSLLSAILLAAAAASPGVSADQSGIQVGILTCESIPGTRTNLLVHSTVQVNCVYKRGDSTERYTGETGIGLGIDLNLGRDEKIAFTVISASSDVRPGSGALAGKYYGGKASATAGVGVGAAALVGGGHKNISLQPLALETSTGVGVAGGLGYLYLQPAK